MLLPTLTPQACKMAIRESIEAEIKKEREYRDNPDMVRLIASSIVTPKASPQY